MNSSVEPIPTGYQSVTPYLMFDEASKAIKFYKDAFGATELLRMHGPKNRIVHAEVQIGTSRIMLADDCETSKLKSISAYGGSPVFMYLYVRDVDDTFKNALSAGADPVRPLENQFYGDRTGMVKDPFGYMWGLASHIEDVSPEEMTKRMEAMASSN